MDVLLAELGDWRRFRSQAEVVSYAGLAPGFRESAGKAKQLGITKEGPPTNRSMASRLDTLSTSMASACRILCARLPEQINVTRKERYWL